jgi:hypothetical protein
VGLGTAWVDGVTGSGMASGAQRHGLRVDNFVAGLRTASRTWGRRLHGQRRHRLGSRQMAMRKGARPWSGTMARRLREDSAMARRLQRGLDDGTGSGEDGDGVGSREIFGRKFW